MKILRKNICLALQGIYHHCLIFQVKIFGCSNELQLKGLELNMLYSD